MVIVTLSLILLPWNPSHAWLNEPTTVVDFDHELDHELDHDRDDLDPDMDMDLNPDAAVDVDVNANLDVDLQVSNNIPPLHDTMELVRLSGLVYQFREQKAKDCSAFPAIYDQFVNDGSSFYYDDSNSQGGNGLCSRNDSCQYC